MIYRIPGHPPRTSAGIISAVWRASETDFDVDAFSQRFPIFHPDEIYRRGEPGRKGPLEESGFHRVLSEAEDFKSALAEVLRELSRLKAPLHHLADLGIDSEVDFGLLVGDKKYFIREAYLSPAELRPFVEAGVGLTLTAYPWDEDDEETRH